MSNASGSGSNANQSSPYQYPYSYLQPTQTSPQAQPSQYTAFYGQYPTYGANQWQQPMMYNQPNQFGYQYGYYNPNNQAPRPQQPYNPNYNQNRSPGFHNNNFRHQKRPNNQQNQHQQNGQGKKQKVDKRDLPENNKYYCEACDRGFKCDEKYKEHVLTHRVCGVDGCKYEAAEKLVAIHHRNLHATGLHKKLGNLESPDEVKKYREERKKNFPTKDNAEMKSEVEKDKIERRELLTTKDFRRDKRGFKKNRNNKRNHGRQNDESLQKDEEGSSPVSNKAKAGCSVFKRKDTLLEKLLAPEIRHERNALLQCINYVVKNNFFENKKVD